MKLRVIPEPEEGTRAIFVSKKPDVTVLMFVEGRDKPVHTCGSCDAPLVIGMGLMQLQGVVLQCNGCGAYNETMTSPGNLN